MGSAWNQGWSDEEEGQDAGFFTAPRPAGELKASELDMLRRAPDYDAEEMATVRPLGGWPPGGVASALASPPATAPAWSPPNRVEPPARSGFPLEPATGGSKTPRTRFPEERTVALLAEDLLGRSLDEPPVIEPGAEWSVGGEQVLFEAAYRPSIDPAEGDLWDQVMPQVFE